MKLSVIVPVFNMASDDKLKWCMDSLVGQTISDYEIIAVDDCSTDDSLSILQNYEKRYPGKVVVIASPDNRKQGGAKNLGLSVAKGDWIGFIDADDWVCADFYEKLLNKAEETGADMVGRDFTLTKKPAGRVTLDLGEVVSTARVLVNGREAGLRLTPPWRFDVTGLLQEGANRIEIRVCNTTANIFLSSPTVYRGGTKAIILGPVRIEIAE